MAYSKNQNPFYTGDDEEKDDPFMANAEDEIQQLQQLRQKSMNNQLASTRRAMATIYDSENIGIATAEELVHQGEQLDNVETKLDQIDQDMKTSQRHITNIKSIFGGIKNWWSGNKEGTTKDAVHSEKSSRLQGSLDHSLQSQPSSQSSDSHPALKFRQQDQAAYNDTGRQKSTFSSEPASRDSEWATYEKQLDQNMDEMSSGLTRLKQLGMGLGDEIERQNVQVDRITGKAERADVKLSQQNRQMRQILK